MTRAFDQRLAVVERGHAELAEGQARMGDAIEAVRADVGAIGEQVGRLVDVMSSSEETTAARAAAVKSEIRDESDRKARDRGELFKNGLALLGGVALVVTALCGPYIGQLRAASDGQVANTRAIAAQAERLATVQAEADRQHDSSEIQREGNQVRSAQILDLAQRVAGLEAMGGAHKR